ncbi:SPASM domain-containing protein [Streptomyces sp. NPDC001108]
MCRGGDSLHAPTPPCSVLGCPELPPATFAEYGVKLATSYYSDTAEEHDQVTQLRGSHRKTRANVQKALELGIPLRGGVVAVQAGQRVQEAARDLTALGVGTVGGDRTRAFGRASNGAAPTIADLCGHCAHEKCAIGPTGDVWPCVLGRFLTLGNVLEKPISDIWGGAQMTEVAAEIAAVHGDGVQSCTPPQFLPMCGPCGPCVPSVGHCDPKEAGPPLRSPHRPSPLNARECTDGRSRGRLRSMGVGGGRQRHSAD